MERVSQLVKSGWQQLTSPILLFGFRELLAQFLHRACHPMEESLDVRLDLITASQRVFAEDLTDSRRHMPCRPRTRNSLSSMNLHVGAETERDSVLRQYMLMYTSANERTSPLR